MYVVSFFCLRFLSLSFRLVFILIRLLCEVFIDTRITLCFENRKWKKILIARGGGGSETTWNGINFHRHIMMCKCAVGFFQSFSCLVFSSEHISTQKISSYTLDIPITNPKRNVTTSFCCWCIERVQFTHILEWHAHIHSCTNLPFKQPAFFLYRYFFFALASNFLLYFLLSWWTIHTYLWMWMQSEIGICFEEQNTTNHKYKHTAVIQTILLRQSEHSMKINATPGLINENEIFLYVWTLNLAQTK